MKKKNTKLLAFLVMIIVLIICIILYFKVVKNNNKDILDCKNNECYTYEDNYKEKIKYMIIDNYENYLKYKESHKEDFEVNYNENFFDSKKLVIFESISPYAIIKKVENNIIYYGYINTIIEPTDNNPKICIEEIDKSIDNSKIEFIMN